ncbi:MAG: phytoene desaturase family protein [Bacilli bacterium]
MKRSVGVIGAGPGGLASALLLQAKGYDVVLYERQNQVGGRNSAIKLGNYTFDAGPTFLSMVHFVEEIFGSCGLNAHDYMKMTRLEHMYDLYFQNQKVAMYQNREKMINEIRDKFPGNEIGYDRFMDEQKTKLDYLTPILQNRMDKVQHYLTPRVVKALPHLTLSKSLYDVLSDYFTEENLRLAFTFQAKYLGMSPWDCPGAFSILSYMEHHYGIYHLEGGIHQLTQGFKKAFLDLGGTIELNTAVAKIEVENNIAVGVRTESGDLMSHDSVVVNADFGNFATKLLPPQVKHNYTKQSLDKKKWSCSTFMIYLGVNKDFRHLAHHSICFSSDYRKNVEEITGGTLSADPSIYIHNACTTDDTLAPSGKSALYILAPVPNHLAAIEWSEQKQQFRDRVLKTIAERTPFGDLVPFIEEEKIITPENWSEDYAVYNGATFNLGHQLTQMMYLRPHNEWKEVAGVYLVGGGTHPGSGLPTILESARISTKLLHHYLERKEEERWVLQ